MYIWQSSLELTPTGSKSMDNPATFIKLNKADNVVIALKAFTAGDAIDELGLTLKTPVPFGHKIALEDIGAGQPVRRYGQMVALAREAICAGEHVHENIQAQDQGASADIIGVDARPTQYVDTPATFMGYKRANGQVGTRNYIGIISTVNCSATASRAIADHYRGAAMNAFPNVDGVVALTHGSGCAMPPAGDGMKMLRRVLAGYARNPNFSAIIVLGLGCEQNSIAGLLESEKLVESDDLVVATIQDMGGTRKTVDWGIAQVDDMLLRANQCRRQPVPASHLILGTQCGGSDALSGVSANSALGYAVDLLVANGGTGILSETVELHGADHLLLRRCASKEVGMKLMGQLDWWRERMMKSIGQVINVTPGNFAGGLSTAPEKSLGSFAKGGSTNLVATYDYGMPVTEKGFVYMDTPAFDPSSVTGQISGGANIVCFTTGRGSAFGSVPSPCLKLSSNNELYERQSDDIDLNAGTILSGEETVRECGERLFQLLLDTASGKVTKSEEFGYGQNEFTPWIPDPML
jgi:altronate hydrolase